MVSRDSLPMINGLNAEKDQLMQALENFDDPAGQIISLTVGPQTVEVNTADWTYPPQMVTAIKEHINQRLDEITKQLNDLGVTADQPQ